jgi:hypothetical protein
VSVTVTLSPLSSVTSSPAPGTATQLELVPTFQFPPAALL